MILSESGPAAAAGAPPLPAPAAGDLPEKVFVGGVGIVLTVLLLVYVGLFSSDIPTWDDFETVPVLTGHRPFSMDWLWEQGFGHRAPLRRILVVLLHSLTGHGFRATAFLNAILLAASAALCVGAARRLRGRTAYVDALFPLLLLNPGWGGSLLSASLVTGFLRTTLLAAVLHQAAGMDGPRPARALRGVAFCALGLSLCITTGVIVALPLAAWAAWATWRLPDGGARGDRGAVLGARIAAAAVGLYAVLYFAGLSTEAGRPPQDRLAAAGRIALQSLGQGFGPAGAFGWRQERWDSFGAAFPPLLSLAALLLVAGPLVMALLRRDPAGRLRRDAFAAVAAAVLLAEAATGWGRAGLGRDFGLQNHYGLTAAPGIAAGILLLLLLLPRARSEFLLTGVFAVCCALLTFNLQVGYRMGRDRREGMRDFDADVRSGMDPARLAQKHVPFLHGDRRELELLLDQLRRAGWAPFPRSP